jgi:ADP-heptose:LPS heptosyltransferase
LQKGVAANDIDRAPIPMVDWASSLTDFGETAAAMATLDLVITVDTSVAHLAGAIGQPVLTMLHHFPDWRWMLARDDSPWYPTMRLLRQSTRGDWTNVLRLAAEELKQRLREAR